MKNRYCLSFVLSALFFDGLSAGGMRIDIGQNMGEFLSMYLNFAQNKGQFWAGNNNISIPRADGTSVPMGVVMPDFSSVNFVANGNKPYRGNTRLVATLIDPNYSAGVAHNDPDVFTSVSYGKNVGNNYKVIKRNDEPSYEPSVGTTPAKGIDFHTPRFNKVVTDVAPTTMNSLSKDKFDMSEIKETYSLFARVGGGRQQIVMQDGSEMQIFHPYTIATGGTLTPDTIMDNPSTKTDLVFTTGKAHLYSEDNKNNPLPISLYDGDSGSPLWGFNKKTNQWELVAVARAITGSGLNLYTLIQKKFIEEIIKKDTSPSVKDTGGDDIVWKAMSGSKGEITQGSSKWEYIGLGSDKTLATATNEDLAKTKHIAFDGNGGTIKLEADINLGAGKLTFKNNYLVTSEDKSKSWVGAGIEVDSGKSVTWQVMGKSGDKLHKIGKGTLVINGNGDNEGGLSLGDGEVVLNQIGGKAFKGEVDIISGRGTLTLGNDSQIDTQNLIFKYRGGRLNLNGNTIGFGDIKAVDNGAMIVNHLDKKATLVIDPDRFTKNVTTRSGTDTILTSSKVSIYHGRFGESDTSRENGSMDVEIKSTSGTSKNTFAMGGGMNLNGDLKIGKNNEVVLQGYRDYKYTSKFIPNDDGTVTLSTGVVDTFYQSTFRSNNIDVDSSDLYLSPYSSTYSTINLKSSNLTIGFVGDKSVMVRDDTFETLVQTPKREVLSSSSVEFKNKTSFDGVINIDSNSRMESQYATITGSINGEGSASIKDSILKLMANSNVSNIDSYSSDLYLLSRSSTYSTINLKSSNLTIGFVANRSTSVDVKNKTYFDGSINIDSSSKMDAQYSTISGSINGEGSASIKDSILRLRGDSNVSTLSIDGVTAISSQSGYGTILSGAFSLGSSSPSLQGDIKLGSDSVVTISDTKVQGTIKLQSSTAPTSSLTLKNVSLKLTGNSDVWSLTLNDSMLGFGGSGYSSFSANSANGNAEVLIRSSVSSSSNDKLLIGGIDGENLRLNLKVENTGDNTLSSKMEVIKLTKADDMSKLLVNSGDGNEMVDVGALKHSIGGESNSIYLYAPSASQISSNQQKFISKSANVSLSHLSAIINSLYTQRELIYSRDYDGRGWYYLGDFSSMKYGGSQYREFSQNFMNQILGFDYVSEFEYFKILSGVSVGYQISNIDYDSGISGSIASYSFGTYQRVATKLGIYFGYDFYLNFLDNNINFNGNKIAFDSHALSASANLGYGIDAYVMTITPQLDFRIYELSSSSFEVDSISSRWGSKVLYEIYPSLKLSKELGLGEYTFTPYGILGYGYGNGAGSMYANNIELKEPGNQNRFNTTLGTKIKVDSFTGALEAKYITGEHIKNKFGANVRVGWLF